MGVARRREGIPATLSYIYVDLDSNVPQRNPALMAYPNFQTHTLIRVSDISKYNIKLTD